MTKLPSSALIIDTKLSNVNSYLASVVAEGFEAVLGDRVAVSDYHRCLRDAQRIRPDFVLCFDGQESDESMIMGLRQLTPKMVLWLTEDPYERRTNSKKIDPFDLVLTNDAGSVDFYRDARVRHLPLAASPRLHDFPVVEDESKYLYDVFFAGVAWPNRVRFLRSLCPKIADLRVRTILPHNEALRPPNIGLPQFEVNQRLSNKDIAFLQNRSRVVLYLDRDFSASHDVSRSITPGPRLFEAALAGAFQLAHGDAPGIAECFTTGKEIVTFEDADDCERKIRHFLARASERKTIAAAAKGRAAREHLYEHRAREVLRALASQSVNVARVESPARPATVLFVAHNSAGQQPFGGTELHVKHTRAALPRRFRTLAYHPDNTAPGGTRLVLSRTGPDGTTVDKFVTVESPFDPFAISDPKREQAFARILEQEQVDVVHFMHLMNHPPTLIEVARRHGARTVVTLPDFFTICPRFTLLNADNRSCWDGLPPLTSCDIDLKRADQIEFGSQGRRRSAFSSILSLADALTCLSKRQAQIIAQTYPHLRDKIDVIRWGIDRAPFDEILDSRPLASDRFTVATVGNFTRAKGAEQLIYLFNYFRGDSRVRFLILGRVDPPYGEILRQLELPNLQVMGEYSPADLPQILGRVDVALFASIWEETFVLALSEAWASGVVPIATNIGALGERVEDGVNGLLVPPGSSGHLAQALDRLLGDRPLLDRLRVGVMKTAISTIEQSTESYVAVYDRLLEERGHVPSSTGFEKTRTPCTLPSSIVRARSRWGWTQSAPHVATDSLLSRRRQRSNGSSADGRLSTWMGDGLAATVDVDPSALHGDEMLNGSPSGPSWLVQSGRVRAVKLFGVNAANAEWQAFECAAEDHEAGLHDWVVTEGSDPQLVSPELDFDWGNFDGILVSMAAQAEDGVAGGQIFISSTRSQGFTEPLSLRFVVNCDGCVHRYVIRPQKTEMLRLHSSIRRVRLDPLDVRGSFYIEKIVLFADRPRMQATVASRVAKRSYTRDE